MEQTFKKLGLNEHFLLSMVAIAVGVMVGYGAIIFRELIELFQNFFMGDGGENVVEIVSHLAWWQVCLMPVLGGLVVGPMVHFFFPTSRGHGVPEVMAAVALQGGRLNLKDGLGKMLSSSISIGAGASVGREGPVIFIGSVLASWLGQKLHMSPRHMRTMVACGAAAGIAASFNAPIAGVMFALEVIVADYSIATFSPVVLSSVIATIIARLHLGNFPAFIVPHYTLVSAWEIPAYAGLGVVCAMVAMVFMWSLFQTEDLMAKLPLPRYMRPLVGGLLLGGIALLYPQVMGVGYDTINLALLETMAGTLMAVLVLVKIIATAITLGSGFSGGVFTPSLYLGALVGGAYGAMAHALFPAISAGAGAYALVGMGAMAACVLGAPIASILILFELTGDYRIMLALMVCAMVATLLVSQFYKDSIYTRALRRSKIDIWSNRDSGAMGQITVAAVMKEECAVIPETMTVRRFKERIRKTHEECYVVVTEAGHLKGLLEMRDLRGPVFNNSSYDDATLGAVIPFKLLTVTPADSVLDAFMRMASGNVDQLPVVSSQDGAQLLGVITKQDLLFAYNQALEHREEL